MTRVTNELELEGGVEYEVDVSLAGLDEAFPGREFRYQLCSSEEAEEGAGIVESLGFEGDLDSSCVHASKLDEGKSRSIVLPSLRGDVREIDIFGHCRVKNEDTNEDTLHGVEAFIVFVGFSIILLAVLLFLAHLLRQRLKVKKGGEEEEIGVDVVEKLKSRMWLRIKKEDMLMFVELCDTSSDVANGVMLAFAGAGILPKSIWVASIVLAAYVGPLGVFSIMQRMSVRKVYKGMMTGGEDKVMVYASALDDVHPADDETAFRIRHLLCILDLTIVELGIRTLVLEDAPSVMLNSLNVAISLLHVKNGAPLNYGIALSLLALCSSSLMVGRKMGAPDHWKEIALKKRDMEEKMDEMGIEIYGDEDEEAVDDAPPLGSGSGSGSWQGSNPLLKSPLSPVRVSNKKILKEVAGVERTRKEKTVKMSALHTFSNRVKLATGRGAPSAPDEKLTSIGKFSSKGAQRRGSMKDLLGMLEDQPASALRPALKNRGRGASVRAGGVGGASAMLGGAHAKKRVVVRSAKNIEPVGGAVLGGKHAKKKVVVMSAKKIQP
ncbi:hypothetical protein TeGR_g1243, partial [Tetraparma gracilis]